MNLQNISFYLFCFLQFKKSIPGTASYATAPGMLCILSFYMIPICSSHHKSAIHDNS